ncbi:MAG: roadblock/LC7 domain-containing protein [candidate division Zixibacteria bacterium]|nr:roadblock/LC7 domain-containing protein [candidate division Zixibacteria bacterium]
MSSDYRGKIRGILLVSFFIMVVPLIFFPKDFGLKLDWSPFSLFAFELCWYMLILFVMFSRAPAPKVFLFALLTLSYRIGLGIGFGILLLVMFSLPLFSSLQRGIYQYVPAFLLQALMSPFVLKSLFESSMGKTKKAKETPMKFERGTAELLSSSFTPETSKEKSDGKRSIPSQREIKMAGKGSLESVLHYLREYAGVKAAILVDQEGLVVANDSLPDFDTEKVASLVRSLKETNDQILHQMGEKASERIGIHTSDLWVCLNQIENFTLVVVSDRRTDELLSVRILQATGMIEKILVEKYQQNILKVGEA